MGMRQENKCEWQNYRDGIDISFQITVYIFRMFDQTLCPGFFDPTAVSTYQVSTVSTYQGSIKYLKCDEQYLYRNLVCGTIKCPNFSQENDIDDDVDLSSTKIDKDEVHDNEVLKFVKSKGHRAIRSAMKVL